jgi:hypothetical protein
VCQQLAGFPRRCGTKNKPMWLTGENTKAERGCCSSMSPGATFARPSVLCPRLKHRPLNQRRRLKAHRQRLHWSRDYGCYLLERPIASRGMALFGRALVVGLLLPACGGMYNSGFRSDLEKRASFDFGCPASQLSLTELSSAANGLVTSYGVRGCGKQATYVLNTTSQVWVLNTDSRARQ